MKDFARTAEEPAQLPDAAILTKKLQLKVCIRSKQHAMHNTAFPNFIHLSVVTARIMGCIARMAHPTSDKAAKTPVVPTLLSGCRG